MITYEGPGDLFTSKMQTLVCPVNCRGVMGAGLALAFKRRYPKLFKAYWDALQSGKLALNRPCVELVEDGHTVLLFASKDDWRRPSEVRYIKAGLKYLAENYKAMGIQSVAFPPVGCGLGGLLYQQHVAPLIHKYLGNTDLQVEVLMGW